MNESMVTLMDQILGRPKPMIKRGESATDAPLQTKGRPLEVLFTERAVRDSDVLNLDKNGVPSNCRVASPDEVSFMWKTKSAFRQGMYNDLPGGVWTNQIGLRSSGPHKIENNGNHVPITRDEFDVLDAKDRSWHYPGNNLVVMISYVGFPDDPEAWALGVDAEIGQNRYCRVAYVRCEENASQIADVLRGRGTI
jgi:hypothetical protein